MSWFTLILPSMGYLLLVALNVVFVLFLLAAKSRVDKRAVMGVAGLSAICLVVSVVSHSLIHLGFDYGALYIREFSTLIQGICTLRLAGTILFDVTLPAFHIGTSRLLHDLVVASLTVGWFALWTHRRNLDWTSLIAPSAVVTAVLGLSLQDTLGNVIGGVALHLEESIQINDWIKIDDLVGRVAEIRWRYTALETRNWETLIIPNSTLLKQRFMVLGRRQGQPTQLRRWIWFNVDFRHSPTHVISTVLEALSRAKIPNVAAMPTPTCVFMDMFDSYGRYAVRYHLTDLAVDDPTDSAVRCHVFTALRRAGIPLSVPAHAVFLTKDSEHHRKRHEEQSLSHRIEILRRVELFSTLTPPELTELAAHLIFAPFIDGDVMTRQGAEAHWLYILASGHADVVVENDDGDSFKIADIGPDGYFGEMGLLTGSPRTATVIARDEVECYRLDKNDFEKVIRSRPKLAEEMSSLLAERQGHLQDQMRQLALDKQSQNPARSPGDIVTRIRHFFGLEA